MQKLNIEIPYNATYIKVGSVSEDTKNVWMIFHGYGQLAEKFAESFSSLFINKNYIIFPQGLSKFYLKGVDQNIGANWMTSHDREIDIKNYLNYLDEIYKHEIKPLIGDKKLNLLGFSQGGHTVTRWITHSKVRYDKLMLWGSGLAHDINKQDITSFFSQGENVIVVGDQDRFITPEQLEKVKNRYLKIGFRFRLIDYSGGHEIIDEVLDKII